ncbi:DNA-binding phage protein [Streptococcus uberis]|nr:DNA-binding phage protein [Streptococcus uberis]
MTSKKEVAITVTTILENFQKPEPRLLGLITQSDLKKELDIDYNTLRRWEDNGLPSIPSSTRRYT